MSTETHFLLNKEFLLQSNLAERLYFNYAANQPIIDFHSHLSPSDLATDKRFENLTSVWLNHDHYKWRAMRTLGINERLITGDASDEEKFHAWAKTVPHTIRNPLFHWSCLELKNSFDVAEYLNPTSATRIYEQCNEQLKNGSNHTARGFLNSYGVVYQATTDDPCDDLSYHAMMRLDTAMAFKVAPTFRPDKCLQIQHPSTFIAYLRQLSFVSGVEITDMDSLLQALKMRVDYFCSVGCIISDHGLIQIPLNQHFSSALENEFKAFLAADGKKSFSNPEAYAFYVLVALSKMYHEKGWVQQFHLGAIRNNNSRLNSLLGADAGFDSIGDYSQAERLSSFLNQLDSTNQLTKTIIYNLNPSDNAMVTTMTGNFNDGAVKAKVQMGPAWWFMDQKNGIEQHLDDFSAMGLLSTFIGMITDSRSLLSFSRHEYFRRILCNVLANDMNRGIIPNDEQWIGSMVEHICFKNARDYFEFNIAD
jgi:glucuronate isomerase